MKITYADGTIDIQPAYTPKEARRVVGQGRRTEIGPPPPWLTARHPSSCPVCNDPIRVGDRIDMRGWEQRRPVHHHCVKNWRGG